MRDTPKISVSPAETRNSADADARPFNSWIARAAKDTASPTCRQSGGARDSSGARKPPSALALRWGRSPMPGPRVAAVHTLMPRFAANLTLLFDELDFL